MLEIIDFYNSNKYGVDIIDQMIDDYSYDITTRRWPLKTFTYLVDMAALNAFVLYKQHFNRRNIDSDYDKSLRKKFLVRLASQLVADQQQYMAENNNNYIYKGFKEAANTLQNLKKKFAGLLPSKVWRCKAGGHTLRGNQKICDNCTTPVCEEHLWQKVYCYSCANPPNHD